MRQAAPRWLVFCTLASLGVLVQTPWGSRWLNIRPLHVGDWVVVVLAFLVVAAMALALAAVLKRESR